MNTLAKKDKGIRILFALLIYYAFNRHQLNSKEFTSSCASSQRAKTRRIRKREEWSSLITRISDIQFRRMFRMSKQCFVALCDIITSRVGESKFKSESCINAYLRDKNQMFMANQLTTGGYICGEVKLAITLRLLAGGSCCDLAVIFDISHQCCNKIMLHVLRNWINNANLGNVNINEYLENVDAMKKVSEGFSKRLNGILKGAIGAIDGWLVRIERPSCQRDKIKHASSFFSRKGFYALNVQVIVDDEKRASWMSYSNRGSSHDSSCFKDTRLHEKLKEKKYFLHQNGFYILGDSACGIESFLLTPFDLAQSKTPEDDFNFFHSSARITVKCAFGKIDLRWGIFWKRICFSLHNTTLIIEGAMRLHNFLVDYRNAHNDDTYKSDRDIFREDIDDTCAETS